MHVYSYLRQSAIIIKVHADEAISYPISRGVVLISQRRRMDGCGIVRNDIDRRETQSCTHCTGCAASGSVEGGGANGSTLNSTQWSIHEFSLHDMNPVVELTRKSHYFPHFHTQCALLWN